MIKVTWTLFLIITNIIVIILKKGLVPQVIHPGYCLI